MRSNFMVAFLMVNVMLAACAPAPAPIVEQATALPAVPTETPFEAAVEPSPAAEQPQETVEAPTAVPQVATSRGPNLESTAPSSVALASGQLQLVEFFRYT
jgi:hypothetical protein